MRTLPAIALVLFLALGCGSRPAGPATGPGSTAPVPSKPSTPSTSSTSPATANTTSPSGRPSLPQVVAAPHATLSAVMVRPGPDGYTVRAWWLLAWRHRTLGAIVTSEDGMRTASYVAGSYRAWTKGQPALPKPSPVAGMGDLMATDVFSLRDGIRAQQGGGDGATLDPFQRVMRSVDGGPWQRFDVPRTDGQQAYTGGQVVLPDGRLLVLLDAWSGDRRGRVNPVWHGLWTSAGDDWSSYRPWKPTFSPALPAADRPFGSLQALGASLDPDQTRDGIVWMSTRNRVYVSTDQARSFLEIPARPAPVSR